MIKIRNKILYFVIIVFIISLVTAVIIKMNNDNNKQADTNETNQIANVQTDNNQHWLKINGAKIEDYDGNTVQLKGLSSHSIVDFADVITYDNLKKLKEEWGINCFRIAMYTDPNVNGYVLNPEQNKNNATKIIDMCEELEIYAVIDWHVLTDGNPQTYQTEAIKFFDELSNQYKENPFLIYEICNEPNNCTWEENVKPYAEEVIKTIRNNSSKSMIWIGLPTWGKQLAAPKENPINIENIAYSFHFYAGSMSDNYRRRVDECIKSNIPIVVSECGITNLTGNGEIFKEEFTKWVDYLNSNKISWIFWQFSNKEESSSILTKEYAAKKLVESSKNEELFKNIDLNKDAEFGTTNKTIEANITISEETKDNETQDQNTNNEEIQNQDTKNGETQSEEVQKEETWVDTNYNINDYLTETGKHIKEMLSREAPAEPIEVPENDVGVGVENENENSIEKNVEIETGIEGQEMQQ